MSSPLLGSTTDETLLPAWFVAAAQPLLYGLRLSVAVALALLVACAPQLDNPSWAGTSDGIVRQPILGASLRKGFFGGTLTRNFAAYASALPGYTLDIIAGDPISAPDHVFVLAVTRRARSSSASPLERWS